MREKMGLLIYYILHLENLLSCALLNVKKSTHNIRMNYDKYTNSSKEILNEELHVGKFASVLFSFLMVKTLRLP